MAIRILTDTSSDLDFDVCRAHGIALVPMTINVGEASYSDGIDLTHADFFDMLLSDGEPPKTSQPTPHDFLTHFEQAKANGDDMIAILISGRLSGTVQSAQTAKELCDYDRIHIIDSGCATAGIQMLIDEAQRMIAKSATATDIVARLRSLTGRIRIFLGLDTLKYLYRGGRLSRVEAGVGTLAGVHPLLGLKEGLLEVCAKCIGNKKTMRRLTEIIKSFKMDPAFPLRFIYSYDPTNCRALMAGFPNTSEADIVEIGPTLAAHSGPGVYGAVFVEADDAAQ